MACDREVADPYLPCTSFFIEDRMLQYRPPVQGEMKSGDEYQPPHGITYHLHGDKWFGSVPGFHTLDIGIGRFSIENFRNCSYPGFKSSAVKAVSLLANMPFFTLARCDLSV